LNVIHSLAKEATHNIIKGCTVLSVCQQGLNRSGLFAALILLYLGKSPEEAIEHVRSERAEALFNPYFVDYIKKFV
jgi:protein-tyrosine phosphatase